MPPVTPEDVAARFPEAPTVSVHDVQEAQDWAEANLRGPVPDAESAKGRALLRAIMAYAVAVALGLDVQVIRTATTTTATKRIKVGPIEIEKAQSGAGAGVDLLIDSAEYWLARAKAALADAGDAVAWRPAVGVSR